MCFGRVWARLTNVGYPRGHTTMQHSRVSHMVETHPVSLPVWTKIGHLN
ncbi:hypothetical protein F383_04687 [Gossypium arboreum]|uniref:Uncharacterized protein n=1 Tax=Gossypium arboreum TaxID=29729 RepID=A0A0B0PF52_GOSAR|nr:hypothetical protein F383_04687 [Gossypium arboreum]